VDVCRFLLIGDCRKKLLRTPYFFGWHYAVLIIMLIVMALGTGALVCLGLGMLRKGGRVLRISTVLLDILLGFACKQSFLQYVSSLFTFSILLPIILNL